MTMAVTSDRTKPVSRTWMAVAFIATTLVTTGATFLSGILSADHQAHLADKTAQVNRFIEATQAFDPLVVKFVAESRAGKITDETKRSIKANLIQQRSALEGAEGLLSQHEQSLAGSYEKALSDADDGLKSAKGPLDSKAFAQAAVHVAELRPKLYKALRD